MSKIKVIKTEQDYQEALKLVEELIGHDPNPDSAEGEQLSLLTTLIKDYESKAFPKSLPDPIEAIKFRMEQVGLKPADLIPYIGSRSRVSEILSGKRQLTIDMIRALSENLGIPAEVLIRQPENFGDNSEYLNWDDHLVDQMEKRGYFGNTSFKKVSKVELLKNFFASIGAPAQVVGMLRKSNYRSSPLTDKHALSAWASRVIQKAKEVKVSKKYKTGTVDLAFMKGLAKLSVKEKSPILVQEHLKNHGIILVIEPHFQKTYLNGAAIFANKDNPVIGLTLRLDKLDNFWFSLMHEVAHIALHYNQGTSFFFDELEDIKGLDIGEKEREADRLASEALVPSDKWEISPAFLIPNSIAANSLAKELGVHVAIVAGKMRYEGRNWAYLNNIISKETVREYFPDTKWDKK